MKNKINIVLLSIFFCSCYGNQPENTGLEGEPMPSIMLLMPDSITSVNTKDGPDDKASVLLYIGPYCPYSRAQMNEIVTHISDLKNIQFYVFTSWPLFDMKKFCNQYHLNNYQNIKAGVITNDFFDKHFETKGVPYIIIYGRDKKLRKVFLGNIESAEIRKSTI